MSFILARLKGRSIPRVREEDYAVGTTCETGALMVLNASSQWAECGADPAAIGGVCEHPIGANTTGFGAIGGRREFPQGRATVTLVQDEVAFRARYVGSLPANIGGSYGVVRDTDGQWKVDFSDTTNTRVKYVRQIPIELPATPSEVEVVFLAANVQVL
jgi:hypothetical protein